VVTVLTFSWCAFGQSYTIQTFAGDGTAGFGGDGGAALDAELDNPFEVAVDAAGNLYFADTLNNRVRKVSNGVVSTVAGSGPAGRGAGTGTGAYGGDGGPATSAGLNRPRGVALDGAGNLFIADTGNNRIRKVSNGVITTVAGNGQEYDGGTLVLGDGGPATNALLGPPSCVAVDTSGNLFICDGNDRIREVSNGVITTVAGNGQPYAFSNGDGGPATSATLNGPAGVAVDSAGSLYIAETASFRVRKVTNGVITTFAGNGEYNYSGDGGPATSASLEGPAGLALDASGSLYIADSGDGRIRRVANGVITTVTVGESVVLGDNGPATSTSSSGPWGVAVDARGNIYIADTGANSIQLLTCCSSVPPYTIQAFAGIGTVGYSGDGGPAVSAEIYEPRAVAVDANGNVYIADTTNNVIRKVSNGVITTVAGTYTFPSYGGDGGPATKAALNKPQGVAVDAAGNLYIADTGNSRIRMVSNGVITTVAGRGSAGCVPPYSGDNGPATSAWLSCPMGVAVDAAGNLYFADTGNNGVRMVSNGVITTVAGIQTSGFSGDNGPAASAELSVPIGVAVDAAGNLYIADANNNRIRMVSNGVITTVAGGKQGYGGDNGLATSAELCGPGGVAADAAGNLYIADTGNNAIRMVNNGVIRTVAGDFIAACSHGFGNSGNGGPATSADLNSPYGVAVDGSGNVYIADMYNDQTRVLAPSAAPCSYALSASGQTVAPAGGSGQIAVTAPGGCSWAALNPLDWVTLTGGAEGTGNGAVTFSVAPNPGGTGYDRSGTLFIGGVPFTVQQAGDPTASPTITPGGVVPVDSAANTIQPGEWVSIYGAHLASSTVGWNGDFPTSLGGASVTINGRAAYLSYASPTQINLQAPDDATTGPVPVAVTTSTGTATATVTLAQIAPSFLLLDNAHVAGIIQEGGPYGGYEIIGPNGTTSLGYFISPVRAGDTIELFAMGFGPTSPVVPAGQAFSSAAPVTSPVKVLIGGVSVTPSFAGLTGAGLYQINLTVPSGLGTGDLSLVATVGGVQTQAGVFIPVL
jgi:uncharacterized protein (TIGR03437 family)